MNDIHFQGERTGCQVSCVLPLEFVCRCGRSVPERSRPFILWLPTPVRNRPAAEEEKPRADTERNFFNFKNKPKPASLRIQITAPWSDLLNKQILGGFKMENGFWKVEANRRKVEANRRNLWKVEPNWWKLQFFSNSLGSQFQVESGS